jgi:hypothetical protein
MHRLLIVSDYYVRCLFSGDQFFLEEFLFRRGTQFPCSKATLSNWLSINASDKESPFRPFSVPITLQDRLKRGPQLQSGFHSSCLALYLSTFYWILAWIPRHQSASTHNLRVYMPICLSVYLTIVFKRR